MQADTLATRISRAFLKNLIPGMLLWIVAVGIGFAYYNLPEVYQAFTYVGVIKGQYGVVYAACATAFFSGFIPFLCFVATKQTGTNPWTDLLFYLIFWGIKGIEVDLFYRFQGVLFGTDTEISTVVMKTAFDVFLYGPLWAVPTIAFAYLYKNSGFRFRACLQQVDRTFFTQTVPTIAISNIIIWLPAVTVIYLMPSNLQIPLFNLVQCFFALLLNILGRQNPT